MKSSLRLVHHTWEWLHHLIFIKYYHSSKFWNQVGMGMTTLLTLTAMFSSVSVFNEIVKEILFLLLTFEYFQWHCSRNTFVLLTFEYFQWYILLKKYFCTIDFLHSSHFCAFRHFLNISVDILSPYCPGATKCSPGLLHFSPWHLDAGRQEKSFRNPNVLISVKLVINVKKQKFLPCFNISPQASITEQLLDIRVRDWDKFYLIKVGVCKCTISVLKFQF